MSSLDSDWEPPDTRDGMSSAMRHVDCYICAVHRGCDGTPFGELFPDEPGKSQIIAADPRGAFVMIDVAPVAPGHCLVVPIRHRFSMAQLDHLERRAVRRLAAHALLAVREGWGIEPVLFEHGACSDIDDPNRESCGIDHAHLHVLANEGLAPLDKVCGIGLAPLNGEDRLEGLRRNAGNSGYIYVEAADGSAFGSTAQDFPSQALRRHFLAPSMLDPSVAWNWSDQVVLAESLETAQRVWRNLTILRAHWPPATREEQPTSRSTSAAN